MRFLCPVSYGERRGEKDALVVVDLILTFFVVTVTLEVVVAEGGGEMREVRLESGRFLLGCGIVVAGCGSWRFAGDEVGRRDVARRVKVPHVCRLVQDRFKIRVRS